MKIDEIKKLEIGELIIDADLKKYTTYKVGGIAKIIAIPDNVDCLVKLLKYIEVNNIRYKILGFGSNLIFSDGLYDGILIKLDKFNNIEFKGTIITVGAGYSMIKLSLAAARQGLAGLEFASGIPGSVGGAIYMNAGAYGSDMGYIVKSAKILTPNGKVIVMDNKELNYHYRTSFLKEHHDYTCLEATLKLQKGDRDAILEVIRDRKKRRLDTQPLEYPSAGSVFRNPPDDSAWRLVEGIGYKGKKIGDAMVSTKHANYIINVGNASGENIKNLISEIQNKVKSKYDIDLKIEQEFVE